MKRNIIRFSNLPFKNIILDACVSAVALNVSLLLRLGGEIDSDHFSTLKNFILLFVSIRLLTLFFYGIYQSIWRYASVFDFMRLLQAVFVSSLIFFSISYLLPEYGRLPRSVFFIDFFIAMAGLSGIRLLSRLHYERKGLKDSNKNIAQKVLIYGAGENGRLLASRLKNDRNVNQTPIGFIDDELFKSGKKILGIPVLGTGENLESIIESHDITGVIVSISAPSGELVRSILERTRKYNIVPQIYNNFSDKNSNHQNVYREISLYDLLSRKASEIDYSSLKNLVQGKTVLVTGAGGSIGSELARQLHRFSPEKLLLLDHSEFNIYNIDSELRLNTTEKDRIIPLLLDIKDKTSLAQVFSSYKPDIVYHAAAYKHVHLVEYNAFTSILNNVMGTLNLLELCEEHDVSSFLNISTDKAVNPVGVMGSTKRVCELLTSLYGYKKKKNYSSVRFGNVLGSSGSLIPLLQKQIQEGGPLTITHKDMKRYFMLIPEAVSLVLSSSIISQPGDINVLKMGDQVNILELAKSLITLSNKSEDEIEIIFTGLRPGEKMYEELYISGNELTTTHPEILTIPRTASSSELNTIHHDALGMIEYSRMSDYRALDMLKKIASIGLQSPDSASPEKILERI